MNDQYLVQMFWALAVISFPVCILIFTIIFKKEISRLIERVFTKNLDVKKYHDKEKDNILYTESHDDIKNKPIDESNESQQNIEKDYIVVEVCQNQSSGKYFIVIDEISEDIAMLIIPDGSIKNLEIKLFNNSENRSINELFEKNLITDEQIKTYFNYIDIDANTYLENPDSGRFRVRQELPGGDEPDYIKSYRNMLKSQDTWPSRMLKMIETEKNITQKQLKEKIVSKYNYSASDTNGSFHASLRVLFVDGYISADGVGDNKTIRINH